MQIEYDVAIIGAGILGLATARAITQDHPEKKVVVLDKESGVARHQSGRNSGVIHSGLYYRPGSLRAELCVSGAEQMTAFCREYGVPFTRNGKVVIATEDSQLSALVELERRGNANGLTGVRRISSEELREIEPEAAAVAALAVPSTGAVNYAEVCQAIASSLQSSGVDIKTSFPVQSLGIEGNGIAIESVSEVLRVGGIVNCAGLYSDRVAAMAGLEPEVKIVPFRGEYYEVEGGSAGLVRSSIYPVPDPSLPFLGVHLTKGVDGSVHAGPNAVLAAAREGYGWATFVMKDLWDTVRYRGTRMLVRQHWRSGIAELARSASRRIFAASVRTLVPAINPSDLRRGWSGVRAQALDANGVLHDDFLIQIGFRSIHVLNAPSPAATSSFALARHIASNVAVVLDFE